MPTIGKVTLWRGAHIYKPLGEELSAYGVKIGTDGVALVYVSAYSEAYGFGFRTGDFIREVNGETVSSLERFLEDEKDNWGATEVLFTVSRDQQSMSINVNFK
jgi:S1-C subfamily serine protease